MMLFYIEYRVTKSGLYNGLFILIKNYELFRFALFRFVLSRCFVSFHILPHDEILDRYCYILP